jgi:hypothetical protein
MFGWCAPHGLFVAADVLGDLECCQEAVRQVASRRGSGFTGIVILADGLLVDVQVFPHRVLRVCGAALDGADDDVQTRAGGWCRE